MKKKFVIEVIILACCILAGCSEKSNDDSGIVTETEAVTERVATERVATEQAATEPTDLGVDISKIEQIFIEGCEGQEDSSICTREIIERLGLSGYIAIDSENKVDMTNADEMSRFISLHESGEQAEICALQVFRLDGVNILYISSDEGQANVIQQFYAFSDGHFLEGVKSEFEATYFEYTAEGYLMMEGSWQSPEMYVLSLSDEEEHIALRVEPINEQCRALCKKYIEPISYSLNNMFITNWNEDNFGNLDFYDIFDRFYMETYGKSNPYTMNDDLSIGNEYEIPAEEFEYVIMQHFKVSLNELHEILKFNEDKNAYIYRPRGFEESDYAEVPYPEVVAYKENDDGSLTLTVNAVYPNDNTSKMFSTKVTVIEKDGKIYYLSNEILGDEEIDLWWHADRLSDDEWSEYYNGDDSDDDDDYSWLIPQADHVNFTDEEKKQIELDTLKNAADIWELYENVTIDESLPSYSSGIVGFTKEQRIEVLDALGKQGVIAVTDDANTKNGELLKQFYDDYLNGKAGSITIYKVYEDGIIASFTFLYRNREIQNYYVGIKPGPDGRPCISGKSVQEIAAINYTQKGYFIYEDKNPMLHASAFGFFRISPMSDECRSLTDKYLKYLEFQKYKLMVCDWNEDTVHELLMPGMFEDFYYMKYNESYGNSFDAIPARLFEEIMTTYLPVTVSDLRKAYEYNESTDTYSQETVYSSPYSPFLEVTDYTYNSDGTITLFADGVWPDYNSDYAFTSVIVVRPFDDGTFKILSNDITEQELKLPSVAYS